MRVTILFLLLPFLSISQSLPTLYPYLSEGEKWKDVAISDIMIWWCYGC